MHLVCLDWLTISVDCSRFRTHPLYSCEKEPYGTSIFVDMYTIGMDGKQIAILTCHPRMKHMKQELGLLKILNPILYLPNLERIVANVLHDFQLEMTGVSRVDVCADFHGFNDYPEVQDFIRDFLSVKIWKIGAAKYKVVGKTAQDRRNIAKNKRAASRAGVATEDFKVIGQQSSRHTYQYLRFGSHLSDISAYLYNKTQEFKDVKRKNYIEENWVNNGLDPNKTVWRLEFSLKGNGIKFLDKTTGEMKAKTLDMCLDPLLRMQLFNACFNKYWVFRYNDGQVRKDRMKPCNLLNADSSIYQPIAIEHSDETSRENKRMITALEKTYDEIRIKHQVRDLEVEAALDKVTKFTKLEHWRADKYGRKYVDMDFAEQLAEEEQARRQRALSPTLFDN